VINKIPVADREVLEQGLKRLKLRYTREIVDAAHELAMEEEPGYIDFLAYLVDHEIKMREETQRLKNMKRAKFPQLKTLDEFDYSFQNSINQQSIRDLESLDFMHAKENIIFLGPSGVGKTHLATGLGVSAVNSGYKVRFYTFTELVEDLYASLADSSFNKRIDTILKNHLIILDELGYVAMDETASDHIFQFIARAYEKRSVIVTSNLDFAEWGTLFASTSTATATLDRLLHHAHVFNMKGDSYRMRSRLVQSNAE
jgi:DNA replication protein DnaC